MDGSLTLMVGVWLSSWRKRIIHGPLRAANMTASKSGRRGRGVQAGNLYAAPAWAVVL